MIKEKLKPNEFLSLLYPHVCVHCGEKVDGSKTLFCVACLPFFELLDPKKRCPYCFSGLREGKICSSCLSERAWTYKMCSAFLMKGAAATFVRRLQAGRMPYLAETAACFLLLALEKWGQMNSELIVLMPKSGSAGYALKEVGKTLSKQLGAPFCTPFKRKGNEMTLKRWIPEIFGKKLLLVTDVLDDLPKIREAADTLFTELPSSIHVIAIAKGTKSLNEGSHLLE